MKVLKDDQLDTLQIVSGESRAKAAPEKAIPHVVCAFTAFGIGRPIAQNAFWITFTIQVAKVVLEAAKPFFAPLGIRNTHWSFRNCCVGSK